MMCENNGLFEDVPVKDYSDDDGHDNEDEDERWDD